MNPTERMSALGRLNDASITPIKNLTGFILSAFTPESQLNTDYVMKYKDAYSAFLETANYQSVHGRISKEGVSLCSIEKLAVLKKKLLEASFVPKDIDLAQFIERMEFTVLPESEAEPDHFGDTSGIDTEVAQDMRVQAVSAAVMKAYSVLYQSVFSPLHPKGAYAANIQGYPNGVIRHNTAHNKENIKNELPGNDSEVSPTSYAIMVIRLLYRMLGLEKLVETGSVSALELGNSANNYYFTRQHGRLASGVIADKTPRYLSWGAFEKGLTAWVNGKLSDVYKAYSKDAANLDFDSQLAQSKDVEGALRAAGRSLATSVVVEVCDPKTANLLVLRVCAPTVLSGEVSKEKIASVISGTWNSMALRDITYEQTDPVVDYCVYTITIALNSKLERSAPMYSFQVLEDLEATGDVRELIGTHNIIFGRNSDGSLKSYNMKVLTTDPHNTSGIAASQSGKGLTTLSAVASTAMHRQPVFYLDGKPDMALAFWRYMGAHSNKDMHGRVFAFDGIDFSATPLGAGSDAQKYLHMDVPVELPEMTGPQIGGLIVAKTLSLMLAIMKTTSSGASINGVGDVLGYDFDKGGLFVFDEVQKLDGQCWQPLRNMVTSWSQTMLKGDDESAVYRRALKKYFESVTGEINDFNKALSKKSNIGMFTLFQDIAYVSGDSSFKGMFGTNTFMGRIKDSKIGYVNKAVTPEMQLAFENYQWYNPSGGAASVLAKLAEKEELKKPIKPFLLFNDEANIASYCKGVYDSLDPSIKKLIDDENARGDKNRLHIAGLLNYYGVDLAESLMLGYDIAQNFLRLVGFDGSVSDYVLSTHIDTLAGYDYTSLCAKAFAAVKEQPELRLPTPGTPEALYTKTMVSDLSDDGDMAAGFSDSNAPAQEFYQSEGALPDIVTQDPIGEELEAGFPVYEEVGSEELEVSDSGIFEESEKVMDSDIEQDKRGFQDNESTQEFYTQPVQQQSAPQVSKGFHTTPDGRRFYNDGQGKLIPILVTPDGKGYWEDGNGNLVPADGRFAVAPDITPGVYAGRKVASYPTVDTGKSTFNTSFHTTSFGLPELSDPRSMAYVAAIETEVGMKGKVMPILSTMSHKKLELSLAKRWAAVLDAGAKKVGNANLVTRVCVGEHVFEVNSFTLGANETVLSEANLKLVDIANFAELFKKYKNLKYLELDYPARIAFNIAYSDLSIPFTQSKMLQTIRFKDKENKVIDYGRQQAAAKLKLPEDRLNSRFNTWSEFSAKVNKGSTSALCKPGHRLVMADFTKRMASGVFGQKSGWSKPRRAMGVLGMLFGGAGTIVTGGVQVARSAVVQRK